MPAQGSQQRYAVPDVPPPLSPAAQQVLAERAEREAAASKTEAEQVQRSEHEESQAVQPEQAGQSEQQAEQEQPAQPGHPAQQEHHTQQGSDTDADLATSEDAQSTTPEQTEQTDSVPTQQAAQPRVIPPIEQVGASAQNPLTRWVLVAGDRAIRLHTRNVLGRQPVIADDYDGAAVNLTDPSKTISKTHARIEVEDETVWITDLTSTNGTTLSFMTDTGPAFQACEPGDDYEVRVGDTVTLGAFEVSIIDGETANG